MAIDRELIKKKLDILKNYIRQIENMDFDESGLLTNIDIQQLLSFRLQQSIETSIDIAAHIIAGLSLERQETAKDIFEVLGKEKIITEELSQHMGLAGNFRNLIVHGYQKLDLKRLFHDYKDDLKDLREYAGQIYEFLQKLSSDESK